VSNIYHRSPVVPLTDARGDELLSAIQRLLRQKASYWENIGNDPKRSRHNPKEAKAKYRAMAEALTYMADEVLPHILLVRLNGSNALDALYALDKNEQLHREFGLEQPEDAA
jgi:hypothetical protein